MTIGVIWAILGGAFACFMCGMGSSIGVGLCGEVGSGVIAEDPEKFGKIVVLQAIPGTQGIYGFIGAFWVMLKINLIGGVLPISTISGLQILAACMPLAWAGFLSAIYQGRVSAAAIQMIAKKPDEVGKGMILAAMVETYAVLGLLATILLVNGVPLK
jgi:V/A-type H+-transporting ATPase subunit K